MQIFNTPILTASFLHLKELVISLGLAEGAFSPHYDYLSLVYFLDACPALETFVLAVSHPSCCEGILYMRNQ